MITKAIIKLKCFFWLWKILPGKSCFRVIITHGLTLRTYKPAEVPQAQVWDWCSQGESPPQMSGKKAEQTGTNALRSRGRIPARAEGRGPQSDRWRQTKGNCTFTSDHAEHGGARTHAPTGLGKCMNLNLKNLPITVHQNAYQCELYLSP